MNKGQLAVNGATYTFLWQGHMAKEHYGADVATKLDGLLKGINNQLMPKQFPLLCGFCYDR